LTVLIGNRTISLCIDARLSGDVSGKENLTSSSVTYITDGCLPYLMLLLFSNKKKVSVNCKEWYMNE